MTPTLTLLLAQATIVLRGQICQVELGLQGKADLRIQADSKTWLRFLSQEASLPLALLSGRIRLRGNPRLLAQFGACFPA